MSQESPTLPLEARLEDNPEARLGKARHLERLATFAVLPRSEPGLGDPDGQVLHEGTLAFEYDRLQADGLLPADKEFDLSSPADKDALHHRFRGEYFHAHLFGQRKDPDAIEHGYQYLGTTPPGYGAPFPHYLDGDPNRNVERHESVGIALARKSQVRAWFGVQDERTTWKHFVDRVEEELEWLRDPGTRIVVEDAEGAEIARDDHVFLSLEEGGPESWPALRALVDPVLEVRLGRPASDSDIRENVSLIHPDGSIRQQATMRDIEDDEPLAPSMA